MANFFQLRTISAVHPQCTYIEVEIMNDTGTPYLTPSTPFPVEWPRASNTGVTSRHVKKKLARHSEGIKKKRTRKYKPRLGPEIHAITADQETQTDSKSQQMRNEIQYIARSVEGPRDTISEQVTVCDEAASSIFESLGKDEATWLADEVHLANKKVFREKKLADKLKRTNEESETRKASLDALHNLLKDLHWNLRYPDEETSKDLNTLDEASGNFGVRNMMNYLGLLDCYFTELQTQLDH